MQTIAKLDEITAKDIIIVANNRQVLAMKNQFGGGKTKLLPQISTINNLLQNLDIPTIDDVKLFLLFKQFLSSENVKFNLGTIKEVINNYHKLRQYKITLSEIIPTNTKQQVFKNVITRYYKYKQENNLLDIFDLYDKFSREDKRYYYFGFKMLNPLDKEFLNNLSALEIKTNDITPKPDKTKFLSDIEEIKYTTNWAYNLYKQDKTKSIVLVHPKLEKYLGYFNYFFNKLFSEYHTQTKEKSFNISLGRELSQYKLGADFLLCFNLYQQVYNEQINSKELIGLISSNYCNLDKNIINKIKEINKEYLTISEFINLSEEFENIWQNSQKIINNNQILTEISKLLKHFGFLVDNTLSSDEYQLFNKIGQELLIFNSLGIDKFNAYDLFNIINYIFSTKVFTPQSGNIIGNPQIQVMGVLEAEGLRFENAWVMGLSDEILPAEISPPSYLPLNLAISKNMVKSSFEQNLADANSSINLFTQLAVNNNFSASLMVDEVESLPSVLINWNDEITYNKVLVEKKINQTKLKSQAKVFISDKLKNAINIIKSQNLCGFRGFATRLNIADIDNEIIGINAKQKGIILHKSLELIYQKINSKQYLLNLEDKELSKIIKASINIAVKKYNTNSIFNLEQELLFNKILEFINLEKTRSDFKVLSLEKQQDINLSGLKFSLRIDRIDEDENGNIIILDYKNTTLNLRQIVRNLAEPQLPLYSAAIQNNATGFVIFKDKIKYQYFASEKLLPSNKSRDVDDYKEQQDIWQENLTTVLTDFKNGKADITPSKDNCKYCNLDSFCRKNDL